MTTTLSTGQRQLLDAWLPEAEVVADLSWGLVGTTVLHVRHEGMSYVVKAGDDADHHLAREIRAHREWSGPWVAARRAAALVHADADAKLLVTTHLPGELVLGHPEEFELDTYRQAGDLLAVLHAQISVVDENFEEAARWRSLRWLDGDHRIVPEVEARLREEIAAWPTPPARLVPTHGDWQPRNWLIDGGVVRIIDFGRADLRPAYTDFARLAAQQFRGRPGLEAAFVEGYGSDPREAEAWRRSLVREAIGTAVWAYQVGDEAFEQQGHRMIADALAGG